MKTVFLTSQVAHVWAQPHRGQTQGRNAGNSLHFDGPLLLSYATPIANILNVGGARIALVSSTTYSSTTSQHISAALSALRDNVTAIFRVPYVDIVARGRHYAPPFDVGPNGFATADEARWHAVHLSNLAYLVQQYADAVAKQMRSQVYGDHDNRHPNMVTMLGEFAGTALNYASIFSLPKPQFDIQADAARVIARWDRLLADPKRQAKAEKAAAAREAKRLEQLKKDAERDIIRLQQFRAGGFAGHVSDADGCAMLRLSSDKTEVQTSWGASVPIADVKRALMLYRQFSSVGASWEPVFGEVIPLGEFRLSSIEADGTVRAGCHRITRQEIERLIAALEGV